MYFSVFLLNFISPILMVFEKITIFQYKYYLKNTNKMYYFALKQHFFTQKQHFFTQK